MIKGWEEVIHTAIIGTDKKQVSPQALPPDLQALREKAEQAASGREEQFLGTAALVYAYRRGGFLMQANPLPPLAPCEPESLPYASAAATAALQAVLGSESESLIYYWLLTCTHKQVVVRPEHIPALFQLAEKNKELQPLVSAAAGRRGAWLSAFNPAWKFTAVLNYAEALEQGRPDERKQALAAWRQESPAEAREALIKTWSSDTAAVRAELLALLEINLSLQDEPFIMEAWKDKSQKVKDSALKLWKALPGSQLVNELWEFVRPLFAYKKTGALLGLLSKENIEANLAFELPEHFAKSYGISQLDANKEFSEKEFTLAQLLQNIPPQLWEQHFQLTPEQILDLFNKKPETAKYISAFAWAANQFKDVAWALPLYTKHRKICQEVVPLMDRATQEKIALEDPIENARAFYFYLPVRELEWSAAFSLAFLAKTAQDTYRYNRAFYRSVVHHFPVDIAAKLDDLVTDDPKKQLWLNMAAEIRSLLSLKQQLIQSF